MGLREHRDGLVQIPKAGDAAVPLIVMLHGAGGEAMATLRLIGEAATEVMILLPESAGRSWDVILGAWGPDVAFLDRCLQHVFDRCRIDQQRIALAGFSDGASYALSLALANGDLFSHALAFSPGFAAPPAQQGRPRIFVSHGTADGVLPIEACSRRLVPRLRRSGYAVTYREFAGGHAVPSDIAVEAVAFLVSG